MLDSIYSEAWKKHFKLSLSVIPYQVGSDDPCVPPKYRNTRKYFSLERNEQLCSYLREKIALGHIEILQHGVTHDLVKGRGEFSHSFSKNKNIKCLAPQIKIKPENHDETISSNIESAINFESYLKFGKKIIENSLKVSPVLFIPPYDDISNENINMLSINNSIPIYGYNIYHRLFRSVFFPNYIKSQMASRIVKKFAGSGFIIPLFMFNLDFFKNGSKDEFKMYLSRRMKFRPISKNKEEFIIDGSKVFSKWVMNVLLFCKAQRNPLCILNHYHHFFYDWDYESITRVNLYKQWIDIISLLDKIPHSWKTNFCELRQRIKLIKNVKITITGDKITVQSNRETITDLAFRVNKKIVPKNQNLIFDIFDKNIITISKLKPGSNEIIYLK